MTPIVLKRETKINKIEVDANGALGIELVKGFHRLVLTPGCDVEATLAAVNANLVEHLDEAPVTEAEWDHVRTVVKEHHTHEAVAAQLKREAGLTQDG